MNDNLRILIRSLPTLLALWGGAGGARAAGVPQGLSAPDWSDIRGQLEQRRHAVSPAPDGHQARNPGQQWQIHFDGRGFLAQPDANLRGGSARAASAVPHQLASQREAPDLDGTPGWKWGLELRRYGFSGQERAVTLHSKPARVNAEGQHLTYDWDDTLQEWFLNDARGLEHGFTVRERPPRSALNAQSSTLNFLLAVRGGLHPKVQPNGRDVNFVDARGAVTVTYAGLTVFDADGRKLPARFDMVDGGLRLAVEEHGARYPLTIDPIAQQARLVSSNPEVGDDFGFSVSVSGDTVVIGAPSEDSNATGVNGDQSDNSVLFSGAAYVFVRNGATWTQQAYLKASNTDPINRGEQFGRSVSISGDTIIIGAFGEDSNATGVNGDQSNNNAENSGAAYVFVRNGATWSQQAYLKASNTRMDDHFGVAVAVAGDTLVVGAHHQTNGLSYGAAYVFVRDGINWSEQAFLKPSTAFDADLGWSVAVSGDTIVAGAISGFTPPFYVSCSACVFVRDGTNWTQQARLLPSNPQHSSWFGASVAISGDTIVVGAHSERSRSAGVNSIPISTGSPVGAAYVFVRSGTNWNQQAYLKASNANVVNPFGAPMNSYFGWSVGVEGNTMIVGSHVESSNATGVNGDQSDYSAPGTGAAYVFVRNGINWLQQAYLKSSVPTYNPPYTGVFGSGVAISGETVVIGASGEEGTGTAYVFTGVVGPTTNAEIAIEQPAGTNLTEGADSISFGTVANGTVVERTFTLRNTGIGDLTCLDLKLDGPNAGNFTIVTNPIVPVSGAGGSTTFTVRFVAGGGAQTGTLHVVSEDLDECPFDLALTGTGLNPQESWRVQHFGSASNSGEGADLADFDHDGVPNLYEFAWGTDPTQTNAVPWQVKVEGDNLEYIYTRSLAALNSGFNFRVEYKDDLNQSWSNPDNCECGLVQTFSLGNDGVVERVLVRLRADSGSRFMRVVF